MKEDTALLPEMFRNERDEKQRIKTEFEKQRAEMERAKKEDAYLRKQVRDLTAEVERKKRLAMQAIAARGQFKDNLNEYQRKVEQFESIMARKNKEMDEAREDRDRFERKHDEMFQAVSGLNGRIEELEQHKLHLLQKLK
jgi:chromosome segregation ATPase